MISLALGAYLASREMSGEPLAVSRAAGLVVLGIAVLAADNVGRVFHFVPAGGFYWSLALAGYAALSIGTVALAIGADNAVIAPVKAALRWRPLGYIGKISYGLYLYHYLILFLFGLAPYRTEAVGTSLTLAMAALLATFAVAALSYHLLESPLLRLKDRLSAGPLPRRLFPARAEPTASDVRSRS
jgi:peptidoglycan/LPS O-acetylase OafA/YrhL